MWKSKELRSVVSNIRTSQCHIPRYNAVNCSYKITINVIYIIHIVITIVIRIMPNVLRQWLLFVINVTIRGQKKIYFLSYQLSLKQNTYSIYHKTIF